MLGQLFNGTSSFAFTALLLTSASPAFAQTAESQPPKIQDAPNAEEAGDIIVTATKRSETLREVPATLVVKSGEELATAGVRFPSDLTIAVPGINYAVSNGFAQPAMRGISTFATAANVEPPVAVYIDGILQPSQSANSAFDLRLVSQAEFLKGPQGTIFGRNVVGGAILFTTKSPDLHNFSGELAGDISAFGGGTSKSAFAYSAFGFVSVPISKDTLAISFGASRRYNQGFIKDLTPGTDGRIGASNSENFQTKVLWKPSSKFQALLNFRYMNSYTEQGPSISDNVATVLRFSDGVIGSLPWQNAHNSPAVFAKSRTYSLSLKLDWDLEEGTFTSISAWQRFENAAQSNSNGGYSPLCVAAKTCVPLLLTPDLPEVISQEVNFSSVKFGPASFVAGVYGLSKKIVSRRYSNNILALDFTSLTRSFAGFAEVTFEITDKLKAIAGGRYNYDAESTAGTNFSNVPYGPKEVRTWSAFTKRFSLKYKATNQIDLYGTYSEGYQPGLVASQTFTTSTGGIVAPTPQINPQHLYSFEVGAKFNIGDINFNIAAYDYRYKNILVSSFDGVAVTLQNAGAASLRGIDTDFRVGLAPGLKLQGGVSWQPRANYTEFPNASTVVKNGTTARTVSVDLKGGRLVRAPKLVASGTLTYSLAALGGSLDLSASGYYSSAFSTWVGFGNVQPAFATLGLNAVFKPNNGPLELSVFAHNLTNNSYINNSVRSAASYQDYYAPPREIGVGARFKF